MPHSNERAFLKYPYCLVLLVITQWLLCRKMTLMYICDIGYPLNRGWAWTITSDRLITSLALLLDLYFHHHKPRVLQQLYLWRACEYKPHWLGNPLKLVPQIVHLGLLVIIMIIASNSLPLCPLNYPYCMVLWTSTNLFTVGDTVHCTFNHH